MCLRINAHFQEMSAGDSGHDRKLAAATSIQRIDRRLSWHKQIESLNNRGRVVTVRNSIIIVYVCVIRMDVNILESALVSSELVQG